MDKHSREQRRKNMQAVKSKGSKIEIAMGKALWKSGLRFRKNVEDIFGKPDFAMKKYKIAVFCDSEFWHGKNWEIKQKEIKSNRNFWIKKIERNIERDKEVNKKLIEEGWIVIRFWEKEIIKHTDSCVNEVLNAYEDRKKTIA
jgi:DNA mismatch endonuclease (patch repair protein)